jgi:hypothetical protein
MKSHPYPTTTIVLFVLLFSVNTIFSRSYFSPPVSPVSGTTNFNSLYSGGFVDLTGTQSASGAGLLASNVAGYNFRLMAATGAVDCGIGIEPFTGQSALVYGYTQTGATNLTSLIISSNDGKFFDLQTVDITIDGCTGGPSHNVELVGYRAGSPVAGALLSKSVTAASSAGVLVNFDVTANTKFLGVDEFRIQTDGSYTISGAIGVDNINAVNFRGILPISLVSYNAAIVNNKAILSWRMVSELSSSNFLVEKSSDGINFSTAGTVYSNEDHIGLAEYEFTDVHPYFGNNYYRITLLELLEQERCLGVRKVTYAYENTISLYPNPVSGNTINLQTMAATEGRVGYTITDMAGRTYNSGLITDYPQMINIAGLKTGFYIIWLNNKTSIQFQKQ